MSVIIQIYTDNDDPERSYILTGEDLLTNYSLLFDGNKYNSDHINFPLITGTTKIKIIIEGNYLTYRNNNQEQLQSTFICDCCFGYLISDKLNTGDLTLWIYNIEDSSFTHYDTQNYAQILIALTKKYKPQAILYPSTYIGRDIAPRVASRLGCGLTADCTNLSVNQGNIVQTRPAFGGNIMADIICPTTRPQMATVRPNVLPKIEVLTKKEPQIITENFKAVPSKVRLIKMQRDEINEVLKPEEAQIVITIGRGVKKQETFACIKELAARLGAALGATRSVVEEGLLPRNHQIGQSGITVKPKIYIAFGVSGALQHTVGMSNSDLIIAVNKDPNAPIFNICQYGYVGDVEQIAPKILQIINKSK